VIDDVCRCFICGAETGCKHLEPKLRSHMNQQQRLNALTVPQDPEEKALQREYIAQVVKHRRFRRTAEQDKGKTE
jgi:hypothetical protein